MNAKETLKLVSKTWCNINDLMKLTGLSRSSVLKIRNKIKQEGDENRSGFKEFKL